MYVFIYLLGRFNVFKNQIQRVIYLFIVQVDITLSKIIYRKLFIHSFIYRVEDNVSSYGFIYLSVSSSFRRSKSDCHIIFHNALLALLTNKYFGLNLAKTLVSCTTTETTQIDVSELLRQLLLAYFKDCLCPMLSSFNQKLKRYLRAIRTAERRI